MIQPSPSGPLPPGTNIIYAGALLLDPDHAEAEFGAWLAELQVEPLHTPLPINHYSLAIQLAASSITDLKNWEQFGDEHKAALINLAVRIGYTLVLLAGIVPALHLALHGAPVTLLTWGIVAAASPSIYASWPADPPLL